MLLDGSLPQVMFCSNMTTDGSSEFTLDHGNLVATKSGPNTAFPTLEDFG